VAPGEAIISRCGLATLGRGLPVYVVQLKQFNISNVGAFHPNQVRLYTYNAKGAYVGAGTMNVSPAPSVGANVYSFVVPQSACAKGGKIFVGIYMVTGNNALAWGNAGTLTPALLARFRPNVSGRRVKSNRCLLRLRKWFRQLEQYQPPIRCWSPRHKRWGSRFRRCRDSPLFGRQDRLVNDELLTENQVLLWRSRSAQSHRRAIIGRDMMPLVVSILGRKVLCQLFVRPLIPAGKEVVGLFPISTRTPTHHRRYDLCSFSADVDDLHDLL